VYVGCTLEGKMLLKTVIQAIPKSSPTFGGYVEWEHKKGRWTKRWLELREHGLWLSKRQGVSLILRALNLSYQHPFRRKMLLCSAPWPILTPTLSPGCISLPSHSISRSNPCRTCACSRTSQTIITCSRVMRKKGLNGCKASSWLE
jgi:hypothetical protein